ncbi:phage structural protein [Lactiplantibacillus nangangensis]|uniref:Phage structural protein n=1 Tax=Lactiplantibacillus nangangensis TaxID=2559917 RepID=A0ABW1SMG8_9LACO|nr:phage protein [Lactiplantibacillus nangangensis]
MAKWEYDATKCTTIVDGKRMFGFQDGDMVSGEQTNDNAELTTDAQGWGSWSINNDHRGTITINLSANSPANVTLSDYFQSNKTVPVSITTPHEHVYASEARIQKVPGFTAGKTTGNRAWQFLCVNYTDKITA